MLVPRQVAEVIAWINHVGREPSGSARDPTASGIHDPQHGSGGAHRLGRGCAMSVAGVTQSRRREAGSSCTGSEKVLSRCDEPHLARSHQSIPCRPSNIRRPWRVSRRHFSDDPSSRIGSSGQLSARAISRTRPNQRRRARGGPSSLKMPCLGRRECEAVRTRWKKMGQLVRRRKRLRLSLTGLMATSMLVIPGIGSARR